MSRRLTEEEAGRGVLANSPAARRPGHAPTPKDVRSLEMMLDYAIIEGAELRLPLFVLLLRAARLELATGSAAEGGPRIAADEAACILAARDVLDGCRHLIEDR